MKKSKIFFGVLRLPVDLAATMAAFALAYYIRPITDLIPGVQFQFAQQQLPAQEEYYKLALVATALLIVLFSFYKLYSLKKNLGLAQTTFRVIYLVTAWLMFIIAYYFLIVHQLFFSRIALAHIWLFTILFVMAGRIIIHIIQRFLLRFGIGQTKVLFVGVSPLADHCFDHLAADRKYKVIGAMADKMESRKIGALKIIGTLDQLDQIVEKYEVEEIIDAEPNMKEGSSSDLLSFCKSKQISYYFIPDVFRMQFSNVEMHMVHDVPLITLKQTPLEGWGHIFKRLFDVLFSLALIVLLIPLWIIIGILIKLDSKGPIIYKSRRMYKDRCFTVYKFRSMIAGAERMKTELYSENERSGPLFKIKNDPRVTSFGRFLRKTSIDELPQLFNVLLGNMSVVGPRPHLPEEVKEYKMHHYQVFAMKPGITGMAQVSGRSNLDFEEEVKLDSYYIENWSPILDIKIILKSILVVFRADGH
jgi:exopolysaccharide biosynthesis polyprenyl glycosylphosphotransferase